MLHSFALATAAIAAALAATALAAAALAAALATAALATAAFATAALATAVAGAATQLAHLPRRAHLPRLPGPIPAQGLLRRYQHVPAVVRRAVLLGEPAMPMRRLHRCRRGALRRPDLILQRRRSRLRLPYHEHAARAAAHAAAAAVAASPAERPTTAVPAAAAAALAAAAAPHLQQRLRRVGLGRGWRV